MKLGGDIALNIFLSVVVLIEDGVFIDLGFILGSSRCPPLGIEDVFGVISGRFFGRVLDFMKGGDLKKKINISSISSQKSLEKVFPYEKIKIFTLLGDSQSLAASP